MAYAALPLSIIPKRKAPDHSWDEEAAKALLAVVSGEPTGDPPSPPTATDETSYPDQKAARAEANKAKRLLAHVMPDGKVAKTVLFGLDKKGTPVLLADATNGFGWAIYLTDAPAPKAEAAPAAAK